MIEIRIRPQDNTESVHLADVANLDDLDKIIPLLDQWGVYYDGEAQTVAGQFVVTNQSAYFEVVLLGDEV